MLTYFMRFRFYFFLLILLVTPWIVFAENNQSLVVTIRIRGVEKQASENNGIKIESYTRYTAALEQLFLQERRYTLPSNVSLNGSESAFKLVVEDRAGNQIGDAQVFMPSFLQPESGELASEIIESRIVPMQRDIQRIKLFYQSEEILNVDTIPRLLCTPDRKCQGYENYLSCPSDCAAWAKDNLCTPKADKKCDVDCSFGDPDCYQYPRYGTLSKKLTTDFSKIDKQYLGYLGYVTIGKEKKGQIDFQKSYIDVNRIDLDRVVTFGNGSVRVDVEKAPGLNKPATVRFFNIKEKKPRIYRGASVCKECKVTKQEGGTLEFTVPDFDQAYGIKPQKEAKKTMPGKSKKK